MLAFCGLLAVTAAAATPNPVIKLNNGVEMPQMAAGCARTPPCYIVTLKTSQIAHADHDGYELVHGGMHGRHVDTRL